MKSRRILLKSNIAISLAVEIQRINVTVLEGLVWIGTWVHMVCGVCICIYFNV